MTFDELNECQKEELKQRILEERDNRHPDGPSWCELADAGSKVSDEDARAWAEGMEFSADDFMCSATPVFRVRVTWPMSKVFQVPAATAAEALERMRRKIDSGEIRAHAIGWKADEGEEVPMIEFCGREEL